ncbi:MAG TPA: Gfo/Idh/MocA family oxidoreductase [Thermoanaerobaculia bacterium]|nr:Gfo/Idh/MocA family oxidoreductase [Thermoanaerobaculia bacterium]
MKGISPAPRRRVAVVGAGRISGTHLAVLRIIPSAEIVAIADRDPGRARSLAREAGVEAVFDNVRPLIESGLCDVAHVLVPPPLHRAVAEPLLAAGIDILIEKPLATTSADCAALIEAARLGDARLGVNQNLLFEPTYRALRRTLASGRLGNLRHLDLVWNVPFGSPNGQPGLWMFQQPQNIVFEQAVHPLSQILDLAGPPRAVRALPGPPVLLSTGQPFHATWQISLEMESATAQVFLAFGQTFYSVRLAATCDDGVAVADMVHRRLSIQERSGRQPMFDSFRDGLAQAWSLGRQSSRNLADGLLAALGVKTSPDLLFESMRGSLAAFYAGLDGGCLPVEARFGADLVALCEAITHEIAAPPPIRIPSAAPAPPPGRCDVALLGGTGFIGRQVVGKLLDDGLSVRVLTRSPDGSGWLRRPGVHLVDGDAERREDVERLIRGARVVVDLVYPKEGQEIDRRMLEIAETVAACCLDSGVERLVYLSSIAALYLGDPREVVTGATRCDPLLGRRSEYPRGKAWAEQRLLELHRTRGLPVSILRPGIVLGEGGAPLHPAAGLRVNEQHCLGWGRGEDPLPLVLVEDVAEAVRLAVRSEAAAGRTYNVVGDVRLTAREYVAEVARALNRPLRFHPRSTAAIQAVDLGKWVLKRLLGRKDRAPAIRDVRSGTFRARFDCGDLRRDLGWNPVADRAELIRKGIEVHARREPPPSKA